MRQWDWCQEGYRLLDGGEVTVYGRVDDDMFESKSIEAGSVYVKDLNTYFHANSTDEEDAMYAGLLTTDWDPDQVTARVWRR